MIKTIFYNYKIFLLVTILATSCVGMNLGMIGHEMINMVLEGKEETPHQSHDCCSVTVNEDMKSSGTGMTMEHHQIAALLVSEMFVFFIIVIAFLASKYFYRQQSAWIRGILYVRQKWWQISAQALLFLRLFSKGILQPRIY